jgi:hypothetical protein
VTLFEPRSFHLVLMDSTGLRYADWEMELQDDEDLAEQLAYMAEDLRSNIFDPIVD